jgi:PBP1b-binding outer membrane lipoprotein LpoB
MRTIQEIKSNFEQILSDVSKISGMTAESAVQVTTMILQESGKFERTEMMNGNRNGNSNSNGNVPATDKQKYALRKNGVSFSDNITKSEASVLLDKVMPKSGSDGKGRASAPSFPK